jgi:hypothetical protein
MQRLKIWSLIKKIFFINLIMYYFEFYFLLFLIWKWYYFDSFFLHLLIMYVKLLIFSFSTWSANEFESDYQLLIKILSWTQGNCNLHHTSLFFAHFSMRISQVCALYGSYSIRYYQIMFEAVSVFKFLNMNINIDYFGYEYKSNILNDTNINWILNLYEYRLYIELIQIRIG